MMSQGRGWAVGHPLSFLGNMSRSKQAYGHGEVHAPRGPEHLALTFLMGIRLMRIWSTQGCHGGWWSRSTARGCDSLALVASPVSCSHSRGSKAAAPRHRRTTAQAESHVSESVLASPAGSPHLWLHLPELAYHWPLQKKKPGRPQGHRQCCGSSLPAGESHGIVPTIKCAVARLTKHSALHSWQSV